MLQVHILAHRAPDGSFRSISSHEETRDSILPCCPFSKPEELARRRKYPSGSYLFRCSRKSVQGNEITIEGTGMEIYPIMLRIAHGVKADA